MKYTLPKLKKEKGADCEATCAPDRWDREIRVPVSKEILSALTVGQSTTLELSVKITGLRSDENERADSHTLEAEIVSVTTESDNEFEKLAEDD